MADAARAAAEKGTSARGAAERESAAALSDARAATAAARREADDWKRKYAALEAELPERAEQMAAAKNRVVDYKM